MGRKSIKRNYFYNVAYQILLLGIPLITTPYISRVLGANGIGTYSFMNSIVSYFTLFASMGIATYGQREASYVQDNREKRTQIFWETKVLSIISTMVCLACYIFFVLFIADFNQVIYLVLSLNIINVIADVSWFFQGIEEFGKIVLRNIVFKVINVVFIFLFVNVKDDLIWYIFGIVFLQLLSSISLWRYLPSIIDKPDFKNIKPFRNVITVISLFIPTIAIQIYTVLDKTMIGLFTIDSFENGYYEQALKMSKLVLSLVTALGTVMIPRIGFYFEKRETKQVQNLMYRGYRFVWFLGIPLCLGLIGISDNIVPWFYGEGFGTVASLLKVSSFLILAIGINNVTGMQYLIPTKRQKMFTYTILAGAGVNIVLNLLLIPRIQAMGAIVASVLAESIIAVIQIVLVRKELQPWTIIKSAGHYVLGGTAMLLLLLIENRFMEPSILHTSIMIITGACVYLGVLALVRDDFFLSNIKSVLRKLRGDKGKNKVDFS